MATTWDSALKDSTVTLSNGDLTCEGNSSPSYCVGSTWASYNGKKYWEILIVAGGSGHATGIGTISTNTGAILGSEYKDSAYQSNGQKIQNNTPAAYGAAYTTGDIIGVAYDGDNDKIWFAKNNAWQAAGDPAAGTNSAYSNVTYCFGPWHDTKGTVSKATLRPDAASQTYSPPAGFSAIDPPPPVTKLFDGKVRIKNNATNLLDGKTEVDIFAHNTFNGKTVVKDETTVLFNGTTEVIGWKANLLDGKAEVIGWVADPLDGKINVANFTTNLFNGKTQVYKKATNLLDGKIKLREIDTDLFDGKVIAKFDLVTNLLDGKTSIQGLAINLFDGKSIIWSPAQIEANAPPPTASFVIGRKLSGDSPVPSFTCTANIGRYPSLVANAPVPGCSMRVGLSLSDIATISQKAGVPIPTCVMVATTHHVATMFGNVPCPIFTCTAYTKNITILTAPVPCPRGLFEATVGNVADILGRAPCPTCSIVAITGEVITLAGSVPVPGSLVRFYASPMNVNITLSGVVPVPTMISCVRGLTSLILRHIRGEVR